MTDHPFPQDSVPATVSPARVTSGAVRRSRTPAMQAAVVLTAVGLEQQPGDPWGVGLLVAEALGLRTSPPPPRRPSPLMGRPRPLASLTHGTSSAYRRGCRCPTCRDREAARRQDQPSRRRPRRAPATMLEALEGW